MSDLSPAVAVGVGGALGAVLRYYVAMALDAEEYPSGTLAVNVLGSFGAGLILFAGVDGTLWLFFTVGVWGSFTTFSSFSFQTVRLWEEGRVPAATIHALGNLLGSLAAIGLAWFVVRITGLG